jgi:hypothetical protein
VTPTNPYEPPRPEIAAVGAAQLPVQVSGVLTPQDAIAALRAVGKWKPWRLSIIAASIGLAIISIQVLNRPPGGIRWPVVMLVAVVAVALSLAPITAKQKFVKSWNSRPENNKPITWTFSEEGLFIEAAHSKHLHAWTAFPYMRMTPSQLILAQHGDAMFNFIPRRFFNSDADWQAACQLLATKLPVR